VVKCAVVRSVCTSFLASCWRAFVHVACYNCQCTGTDVLGTATNWLAFLRLQMSSVFELFHTLSLCYCRDTQSSQPQCEKHNHQGTCCYCAVQFMQKTLPQKLARVREICHFMRVSLSRPVLPAPVIFSRNLQRR
jgi:hypothetical protein